MEALARLGLFFGVYFTVLILTFFLRLEFAYFQVSSFKFQVSSFAVTTVVLSGWLYYLHFIKKEFPHFLQEILYLMIFLCSFTTVWAFFSMHREF